MDASERARLRALCGELWDADRIRAAKAALPALLDALEAAERERDEARAELMRLRARVIVAESAGVMARLAVSDEARDADAKYGATYAERDALRAIIEGRTDPPTRAEIEAHEARGGRWLVRNPELPRGYIEGAAEYVADAQRTRGITLRWIALDVDDRPCAWPVVDATAPAPLGVGPRASALCGEDASVNLSRVGKIPTEETINA